VKDLRARWNTIFVLFTFVAVLGCQVMFAHPHGQNPTGLVVGDSTPNFGTVVVGDSTTVTDTLTNASSSSITINQAQVVGAGFAISAPAFPVTLTAGQQIGLSILFAPTAPGLPSGTVLISSNAPNSPATLQLSGIAVVLGQLISSPASLNFGNVMVGGSQILTGTFVNTGGTNVTISQASISGNGFQLSGINLPVTLGANQSTPFNVTFTPSSNGSATANITLISKAADWANDRRGQYIRSHARIGSQTTVIQVTGTGAAPGQLISAANINFGNTQVGNTQNQSATLTNSGGSSVTVSQATATGAGFHISGLSFPFTIAAGQSVSLTASFSPQSAGTASGNIAVTSNASNPTLNIPLSGLGVTPGALSAAPSSLSFGNVQTSQTQTLAESVTNTGGSSVTITQASLSGSGYSVTGLSLPLTLTSNQSANFSVVFTPQSAGSANGSLALISNIVTLAIPLSGNGVSSGALSASPSSLNFGNVQTGKNQALAETITNTGGSSVTITQASLSGSGYSVTGLSLPLTLTANQSANFSIVFAPQSAGNANGSVSILSNVATVAISLSGSGVTPATLATNPSSFAFGNVQVGNASTQPETLTNTGGSNLTISQATTSGSGFSTTGLSLPLILTPEQSVSFNVIYTPPSAGSVTGSLSIVSNASNSNVTVSLSGTGTASGQLSVTPTSHNFGNVVVGASQSTTASLTATGSSVIVSGASMSTSEFSLSGLSFPFTLAAGQSTSFSITFTPQASGTATATASFNSNAANSPAIASLTGTGSAPPQHQVDLSWNPSNSQGITGYNVYRGSKTGGPYSKINPVLNASTAYTDNSVTAGQSYYYVTTAVDTAGVESAYSNEVPATVPTP